MLTIEQPCAAQKFSAQEFLKALRSAKKNETTLPTAQAARKEANPEAEPGVWRETKESGRRRLTRGSMMREEYTLGELS